MQLIGKLLLVFLIELAATTYFIKTDYLCDGTAFG
jgi:hypothetical protein